ncbi:hypothetical protein PUN28_009040 [Cardiocondyla obscurior]|uniref:Crossover junction endonuclease EME1 n=2 Tax=Cardiocondyla obscurior TaxID=286306 RepID=A0AAW2FSI0_9HYME
MSNVIVLSDSDESLVSVTNEHEYHFNAVNNFDIPDVPFHNKFVENLMSQSKVLPDSNLNDDYEQPEKSSGSEDNQIERTSQEAKKNGLKKRKDTLKEERMKRQQALAKEKALRIIEKKILKDTRPGECLKFMEVNLDQGIDRIILRGEIERTLQDAGVKYNVTNELILSSITWQRNIEENYIDADNSIRTNKRIQLENYAVVIWSSYEAVRHVAEDTFCTSISKIMDLIPNYNITLIIYGMEEYFAYWKKKKSKRNSKNKEPGFNSKDTQRFDALPNVSRQQLEMCLAEIQIIHKCTSRLIETSKDLALLVYQYTKSISEIPYKLQKKENQESKFDWYVMGDNKNTVRVDKDGNGLKRLWQQQLCQFNLSSLETSEAICTVYPSPLQLIKAYRNCTPDEGINLLKDIAMRRAAGPLTTVRKIGPELSKKMYVMFTSQNGDALLG